MATANLNSEATKIITGNDSIVIVDNFQSIRGGRTLDVTGFTPEVIRAGHLIIQDDDSGEYKPMPVKGSGAILSLGTVTAGSGYTTDGTYTGVAFTGGSGTGAKGTVVIAGGEATSATITTPGTGYKAGDSLSAAAADIGGDGSGFAVKVATVDTEATEYDSLPDGHSYAGVLIASILTETPFAGIMVRGTVNSAATPFPMDDILSDVKTALTPRIDFRED